jgi:hypothetical protein
MGIFDMTLTKKELKIKENKITSTDLDQITQDQDDVEKYHKLKEKMQEAETDSYLLDRLEAYDTLEAAEILMDFLSSK